MIDADSRMLMEAILDYMRWVKSVEAQRGGPSSTRHARILTDFLFYVIHKGIKWKEMFTPQTLKAFRAYSGYKGAYRALKALSDYLYSQARIEQPSHRPKAQTPLPDVYEQYLCYHQQSLQVGNEHLGHIRTMLLRFHDYLQ